MIKFDKRTERHLQRLIKRHVQRLMKRWEREIKNTPVVMGDFADLYNLSNYKKEE